MNGGGKRGPPAYLAGMNKRIWLATGLMLLGTLGVLAFQAYWTYQTYQQAERRFVQDAQAALVATRDQALALQRRQLLRQYRGWLRDTSHVRISCFVNRYGVTEFQLASYLAGQAAGVGDKSNMSFGDYKLKTPRITPAARAYFIRRFTAGTIRQELEQGYTFYHTQWLGEQMSAALQRSRTSPAIFRRLFTAELQQRGLGGVPFRAQLQNPADSATVPARLAVFPIALPPQRFGLITKARQQTARVWLPAASAVVVRQLRGVLLASGLLTGLVLGCCGYAVGTMRRQKRLADLQDDFTHNMTHELKTPVATIQLAADSLRHFDLPPATRADYTALIGEQAGRLNALIERILRSVALEQNALLLLQQPLDWTGLITATVAEQAPHFAAAGQRVIWEAPPAPVVVRGDATHLTSALATLLDNARKYGGPNLCLRLEVAPAAISLHLHDDGPGIPAAYQAQVFDKFFRVPTGNLHAVKGSGLGLHYARQVAERHGGTLTLQSAPGRGTTFTLTLPTCGVGFNSLTQALAYGADY